MLKSKAIIAILLSISLFAASCSSIFNGSTDEVRVISNPDKAEILVNGVPMGPTPGMLLLNRGEYHVIEIKKAGYQTTTIRTSRDIAGWFWGNIFCGVIPGMVFDLVTGNAYDVEPNYINVNLTKDHALNQIIEQSNIDGVNLYDENNNLVGKINFTWE